MMKRIIALLVLIAAITSALTLNAYASADKLTFAIETEPVRPDEIATVTVKVSENPGFMYLKAKIVCEEGIELVDIKNGGVSDNMTLSDSKKFISWDDVHDSSKTGTLCVLSFKVTDTTEKGRFSFEIITDSCFNEDENDVSSVSAESNVIVIRRGDVTGSGEVNSSDAVYLLRNTLRPKNYQIVQSGDMNGDGITNAADAIYLLRHTLRPKTYVLADE